MARQDPYIDITIDAEGNIISEVHGVLGPGCEGLVDWVKDLGTVEVDRKTGPRSGARSGRPHQGTGRRLVDPAEARESVRGSPLPEPNQGHRLPTPGRIGPVSALAEEDLIPEQDQSIITQED